MSALISPRRAAITLLAAIARFAIAGPLVWPDPTTQDLGRFLEGPSLAEPLGRDQLGRSVGSRLAHATRLSLVLAALCVATALVAGVGTGLLAAWRGGWVDNTLLAVSETFVALPALLVVLLFAALADGGLWTLYGGLALVQWVEYFRITRARSAVLLAGPSVEAAGLLRLGRRHVVVRHVWPELRSVLGTMAAMGLATAVLTLSTLGFVGVGVRPPTPELGLMVTEAFPLYDEAPLLSVAPVLVLMALMLGLLGLRRGGDES